MLHGVVIVRIWLRRGRSSLERNSLVWQRSRSPRWTALQSGIFAASIRYEAIPHCCFSVEGRKSASTAEAETLTRFTTSSASRPGMSCKARSPVARPRAPRLSEPNHAGVVESHVVVFQRAECTKLVVSSLCVCFLSQHTLQILSFSK